MDTETAVLEPPKDVVVEKQCMFPGCNKTEKTRGLCSNHYAQAGQLVKAELITWEELEKNGKCLAPRPRTRGSKPLSERRAWFLTGPDLPEPETEVPGSLE